MLDENTGLLAESLWGADFGYGAAQGLTWVGQLLFAVWLLFFGASVGSFMNVVIYRLPAGMSVAHPGSRCPRCGRAIRGFDNVPILSWLWLRGACRDCRNPIAARYPCIEALVAIVFLILAVEHFTELDNMRLTDRLPYGLAGSGTIWATYLLHVILASTLICDAMMVYDGHRPPRRLYITLVLSALILPACSVLSRPAPLLVQLLEPRWASLLGGLAGGLAGVLLGWIWRQLLPSRQTERVWLGLGATGLALGWVPLLIVVPVASLLTLLLRLAGRSRKSLVDVADSAAITMAMVAFVVGWKWIVTPLEGSLVWLPLSSLLMTLAILGATRMVRPEVSPKEPLDYWKGAHSMPRNAEENLEAIVESPSYRLAEVDTEFLQRPELRPVRMQLELLKPEMELTAQNVHSTIVVFGGTQIVEQSEAEKRLLAAREHLDSAPDDPSAARRVERAERVLAKSRFYDDAREFARLVSSTCQASEGVLDYVVVTGGGPGIMEAANRGAFDVQAKSGGLNITLPHEQVPNSYITPELCFQFHYFAMRKMHFLMRARALVIFPGGFGTLDELFDALTLRQTHRMQSIPIIMFGREYWEQVINFQFLADEGVIADDHLDLFQFAETPAEAWMLIADFHEH